jgi:hypothetical protein
MKCARHPGVDALAICVHCGVGVCADCARKTPGQRTVCSPACGQSLAQAEAALGAIRRKTLGGHRLTGYFCGGAAAVLAVFALLAGLDRQWPVFALQLSLAAGLGLSGFFYLRLAGSSETD